MIKYDHKAINCEVSGLQPSASLLLVKYIYTILAKGNFNLWYKYTVPSSYNCTHMCKFSRGGHAYLQSWSTRS